MMNTHRDNKGVLSKTMHDTITFRPAQPDDAERAAVLLYSAYVHKQVNYPLPKEGENTFIEHLQHAFREPENRCSYQFIEVATQNSEVVGLVLSFGGREEERLNAAIGWRLERESQNDEWYVDALAVFTSWGRKGVGTHLLQTAEQQGRDHGYPKIALHVAQDNEQALSLYRRLQYVVTHETTLYHHPYVHLVKQL